MLGRSPLPRATGLSAGNRAEGGISHAFFPRIDNVPAHVVDQDGWRLLQGSVPGAGPRPVRPGALRPAQRRGGSWAHRLGSGSSSRSVW